jgi:hypothetical protein
MFEDEHRPLMRKLGKVTLFCVRILEMTFIQKD